MLDKEEKIDYLKRLQKHLNEAIYETELEIRLWERRKIGAGSDDKLLQIETIVKGKKGDRKILEDKLDIVESEIEENGKFITK